ncbi:MAG: glucose-6-phosphate isomerase [Leeuwenhoekiella sp.]
MNKINPTKTESWKKLLGHYDAIKSTQMNKLFQEGERDKKFTLKWDDFYVDYSKNRITTETMQYLRDFAKEMKLGEAMSAYFGGEVINETEGRAVMHTALRAPKNANITVDGKNIVEEVNETKEKIKQFSEKIISGSHKGYTGKAITDVVNIGIGGSDLGPDMVTEALAFYKNHLNIHFISNVDGDHVHENLQKLDPETTLFVVVSKSFTTQETLSNANTARDWFLKKTAQPGEDRKKDVAKHFVAVSTNLEAVKEFGIAEENIFTMWDWVGGRFSIWSAVGLTIAIAVGYNNFESFLEGAHGMDEHFKNSSFEENIPVTLALLTVWYNNFFKAESEAIIPYTQYLHRLPAYLQQATMESNGKSVDQNGKTVDYQTGTIIWGEPGTNSQHAFFQLIHQGTKIIPTDFIGYKKSLYGDQDHHNKLMANYFAQTEALMNGKTEEEARQELKKDGMEDSEIDKLAPFKKFEGNKPTNSILIDKLTPKSFGALIAMYESKIFVEGILWNIFSFDQWGVELGKQLAKNVLKDINGQDVAKHDDSTTALIKYFKD